MHTRVGPRVGPCLFVGWPVAGLSPFLFFSCFLGFFVRASLVSGLLRGPNRAVFPNIPCQFETKEFVVAVVIMLLPDWCNGVDVLCLFTGAWF